MVLIVIMNMIVYITTALTEAQDVNTYLKPLRHHFEDFEQAEFDESKKLFAPMMHCLCLVWSNSEYYNTPARLIVLLQEVCNMIIKIVSSPDFLFLLIFVWGRRNR